MDIVDASQVLVRERVIPGGPGTSIRRSDPFKAAIAFYPIGRPVAVPDTPLLLMTGRKEGLCPVKLTGSLEGDWGKRRHELSLVIYPRTGHSFDFEGFKGGITFRGHHFEFDPEAFKDSGHPDEGLPLEVPGRVAPSTGAAIPSFFRFVVPKMEV